MDGIKMEDFMDVVYKCKFCPYTCTQSPDMGSHVREKHLHVMQCAPEGNSPSENVSRQVEAAEEQNLSTSSCPSLVQTLSAPLTTTSTLARNGNSVLNSNSNSNTFSIQVSDDVLGFTSDSQAYLDKGLTAVSFAPLAVPAPQGEGANLSSASTPDLTELIDLVKPTERNRTQGGSTNPMVVSTISIVVANTTNPMSNSGQLPMESVVQIPSMTAAPLRPYNMSVPGGPADLQAISSSEGYTVMALQVPNFPETPPGNQPQYMVSSSGPQAPINIPDNAETKEFLLCGLCKLAFTSMEDCQAHMQAEHKELMQGSGVSIGVQVGGAKRGRKRKSEMMPKVKIEPFMDPDDLEWLPSVNEGSSTTHPDGRLRRKVKPPKALKEDYVLGKRAKKRAHKVGPNLGYKIVCPMMGCKARFKTNEGLKTHLACHNLQDTAFTCKECQAPHEFWKHLRMHLWRQHQVDVDLLTCDVCSYKTDTPHKMSVHKEIHTDVRPYTCNVCGKGFRQSSQMKNHQVIHTSQQGREASGLWFSSKKCDICDRTFANSKCLKKHKEAVHGNHKPFKCMYCNHTTARKAMLQLHMRTHTGEKPFKCDICSYTTGDHNSMRRHKMRHTGQKQYQCTLCPYTCIQSISLKQHMRHKHPGAAGGIFQCSRCPFRTINQNFYNNHIQDHKKGLIPDKIIPPKVDTPKTRKTVVKSQMASIKASEVETLLVKHPQFHAVVPGEEASTLNTDEAATAADFTSNTPTTEVFNMQVTMLPEGDTQVNAEDMTRLSESPGLTASGVSPLQLIYATLSTISEQTDIARLGEGRSSLLTAELVGGIHTAVLSSMQDGVTVHSITYHLPVVADVKDSRPNGSNSGNGGNNNNNSGGVVEGLEGVTLEEVSEPIATVSLEDDCVVDIVSVKEADRHVVENEIFQLGDKVVSVENGTVVIEDEHPVTIATSNASATTSELIQLVDTSGQKVGDSSSKPKIVGSSTLREMLESVDNVVSVETSRGEPRYIEINLPSDAVKVRNQADLF